VKLLDFGLATLTERVEVTEDATTRTRIPTTDAGTVMGTAPYMSPEQVEGKGLDARSDVFSFGAVLYELLSGRQAFRRENSISISTMAAILHTEPGPLDAPAALQQIVKQCLAKPPGQRFFPAYRRPASNHGGSKCGAPIDLQESGRNSAVHCSPALRQHEPRRR
jgi:serine/threonine protein kinase